MERLKVYRMSGSHALILKIELMTAFLLSRIITLEIQNDNTIKLSVKGGRQKPLFI